MKPDTPPRCIICDRSFETAANDPAFARVPYEGTLFYTTGHYGSTAFDSLNSDHLEIAVCDACLTARVEGRVFLLGGKDQVAQWDGEADSFARNKA